MLVKFEKIKSVVHHIVNTLSQLENSELFTIARRIVIISLILGFVITNQDAFNQYSEHLLTMELQESDSGRYIYKSAYEAKEETLDQITICTEQYIDPEVLRVNLLDKDENRILRDCKIDYAYNTTTEYTYKIHVNKSVESGEYQLTVRNNGGRDWINFSKVEMSVHVFPVVVYGMMIGILTVLSMIWMILRIICKEKNQPKRVDPTTVVFCMLNAIVIFFMIEFLYNSNIWGLSFYTVIGGCVCYFLLLMCLTLLLNSQRWGNIIGVLAACIFGIVNHYICEFRNQPIQPNDFFNIKTASNVAEQYQYNITGEMMIVITLTIIVIMIMSVVADKKYALKFRGKMLIRVIGVISAMSVTGFISSDLFLRQFDFEIYQFSPMASYQQHSFPLSFLVLKNNLTVDKPKGYSKTRIEAIKKSIDSKVKTNVTQTKPNIVAIMNESLADLSYINKFETNEDYMPFWHSLEQDTIKGNALASVFGGTTANSEYEFLTGNSIEQFKVQIAPYMTNIVGKTYSMAETLKAQGYHTTAMHPYTASNYNRDKVYPNLGFDEFYSIDDFEHPEFIRSYLSDKSDYDKVIETLMNNDSNPQFIFNVTMQNHSPYIENWCPVTINTTDVNYSDVNQYLSLVKESDAALQYLIQSVENFSEPTIVVIFGDHYPALDSEFYDWLYGKEESQLTLEEVQKKYSVPFLIWANYDIEEYTDVYTSLNYLSTIVLQQAGVGMTPYNKYLLNMRNKVPALNVNGYVGADGQHYLYTQESDYTKEIEQYDMLQYNGMLDRKNRVYDFFFFE